MSMISQQSFSAVTAMFHRVSGIRLTEAKRALVTGRLQKLAAQRGLADPGPGGDLQRVADGAEAQALVLYHAERLDVVGGFAQAEALRAAVADTLQRQRQVFGILNLALLLRFFLPALLLLGSKAGI